jgi:hypothetical protein
MEVLELKYMTQLIGVEPVKNTRYAVTCGCETWLFYTVACNVILG